MKYMYSNLRKYFSFKLYNVLSVNSFVSQGVVSNSTVYANYPNLMFK